MTGERLSVFENTDDVDLSAFTPRPKSTKPKPTREKVRAVSEAAKFPSRQASAPAAEPVSQPEMPEPSKRRQQRYHRTGRIAPMNCRIMPASLEKLYAIVDQHGWLVGETVERAIDALERELQKGAGQGKHPS